MPGVRDVRAPRAVHPRVIRVRVCRHVRSSVDHSVTSDTRGGRAYIFAYTTLTLRALKSFLDHLVERFRLMGRQGLVGMGLSGLDMAPWDMQGRAQNRPVVELLGGQAATVLGWLIW